MEPAPVSEVIEIGPEAVLPQAQEDRQTIHSNAEIDFGPQTHRKSSEHDKLILELLKQDIEAAQVKKPRRCCRVTYCLLFLMVLGYGGYWAYENILMKANCYLRYVGIEPMSQIEY